MFAIFSCLISKSNNVYILYMWSIDSIHLYIISNLTVTFLAIPNTALWRKHHMYAKNPLSRCSTRKVLHHRGSQPKGTVDDKSVFTFLSSNDKSGFRRGTQRIRIHRSWWTNGGRTLPSRMWVNKHKSLPILVHTHILHVVDRILMFCWRVPQPNVLLIINFSC